MEPRLIPVFAILAVVLLAGMIALFVHLVKPRREIGEEDIFRPDQAPPPEPPPTERTLAEPGLVVKPPALEAGVRWDPSATPGPHAPWDKPSPQPAEPEPPRCKACQEPLEAGDVAVEDWERVQDFWERLAGNGWLQEVFRVLRIVRPRQHGRELYQVLAGYCRSCAAIAQPLHRAHRETQSVRRLAEDRQWEREGLPEAVREAIGQERERYHADKLARSRRGWRGGD